VRCALALALALILVLALVMRVLRNSHHETRR
jgi:flagellar biogenesis protein FliO